MTNLVFLLPLKYHSSLCPKFLVLSVLSPPFYLYRPKPFVSTGGCIVGNHFGLHLPETKRRCKVISETLGCITFIFDGGYSLNLVYL